MSIESKSKITIHSFKSSKSSRSKEELLHELSNALAHLVPVSASSEIDKHQNPLQQRIRQGIDEGLCSQLLQSKETRSSELPKKIVEFLKNYEPGFTLKIKENKNALIGIAKLIEEIQKKEKSNKIKPGETGKFHTQSDLQLLDDEEKIRKKNQREEIDKQIAKEKEKEAREQEQKRHEQQRSIDALTSESFRLDKGALPNAPSILPQSLPNSQTFDQIAAFHLREQKDRDIILSEEEQQVIGNGPMRKPSVSSESVIQTNKAEPTTIEPNLTLSTATMERVISSETSSLSPPIANEFQASGLRPSATFKDPQSEAQLGSRDEALKGQVLSFINPDRSEKSNELGLNDSKGAGSNLNVSEGIGSSIPSFMNVDRSDKKEDRNNFSQSQQPRVLPQAVTQESSPPIASSLSSSSFPRISSFSVELPAEETRMQPPMQIPRSSAFFKPGPEPSASRQNVIAAGIVLLDIGIVTAGAYFALKSLTEGGATGLMIGAAIAVGTVVLALAVAAFGRKLLKEDDNGINKFLPDRQSDVSQDIPSRLR